jgi:hypothetical protein
MRGIVIITAIIGVTRLTRMLRTPIFLRMHRIRTTILIRTGIIGRTLMAEDGKLEQRLKSVGLCSPLGRHNNIRERIYP